MCTIFVTIHQWRSGVFIQFLLLIRAILFPRSLALFAMVTPVACDQQRYTGICGGMFFFGRFVG
jgi:hypothetical protein